MKYFESLDLSTIIGFVLIAFWLLVCGAAFYRFICNVILDSKNKER